jgi:hypothetical protein
MDPDEALRELRRLAALAEEGPEFLVPAEVARMAELFQGLDAWLTSGGFAPEAWLDKRPAGSSPRLRGL